MCLLAACALAGCRGGRDAQQDTIDAADTLALSAAAAPDNTMADSAGAAAGSLVVTDSGIGPVVAGMTLQEAETALQQPLDASGTGSCIYATVPGASGVRLMVVDNHVERVDVTKRGISTSRGAQVGDSEAEVQSLYAPRMRVEPHKYERNGHYLIAFPDDSVANQGRLVFETKDGRVTAYRGGRLPAVQWVEGCS
jgi:hypothetical protein